MATEQGGRSAVAADGWVPPAGLSFYPAAADAAQIANMRCLVCLSPKYVDHSKLNHGSCVHHSIQRPSEKEDILIRKVKEIRSQIESSPSASKQFIPFPTHGHNTRESFHHRPTPPHPWTRNKQNAILGRLIYK